VTHANNEKVAKAKTTPRAAKGDLFDMFGIFCSHERRKAD
jgi:hypothetical protein